MLQIVGASRSKIYLRMGILVKHALQFCDKQIEQRNELDNLIISDSTRNIGRDIKNIRESNIENWRVLLKLNRPRKFK